MKTKIQIKQALDIEVPLLKLRFIAAKKAFEATVFNLHLNPYPVIQTQADELKEMQHQYSEARRMQKMYEDDYQEHVKLCALLNHASVKFTTDDNLKIFIVE
jgi:hypothetical protein